MKSNGDRRLVSVHPLRWKAIMPKGPIYRAPVPPYWLPDIPPGNPIAEQREVIAMCNYAPPWIPARLDPGNQYVVTWKRRVNDKTKE